MTRLTVLDEITGIAGGSEALQDVAVVKILIIGGYRFLGRALIETAVTAGHRVTVFGRGSHNPQNLVGVNWIVGDRHKDLSKLQGHEWDVVIDTCGFTPAAVGASALLLHDAVERYIFISTLSVYPWPVPRNAAESTPVAEILAGTDPSEETPETYGIRKALCEHAAETVMPGRVLNARLGMLVGPHDYLDRLTYWIERAARGGEILAPGSSDRPVQLLDVADLADWLLRNAESGVTGAVNVTGPTYGATMGGFLQACLNATESQGKLTWVEDDFLLNESVEMDADLPYWIPENENGLFEINIDRAIATGLRTRPLFDTALQAYQWIKDRSDATRNRGWDAAREAAVLARYHQRNDTTAIR